MCPASVALAMRRRFRLQFAACETACVPPEPARRAHAVRTRDADRGDLERTTPGHALRGLSPGRWTVATSSGYKVEMLNQTRTSLFALAALGLAAYAPGCATEPAAPEEIGTEAPLDAPVPDLTPRAELPGWQDAEDCADHADEDDPALRLAAARPVTWKRAGAIESHRTVDVVLLGINDFHGQLAARVVAGRPAGGAAVLGAYLRDATRRNPGRSAIVHAGDLVGASPPSSALLQDEPTIQFVNALGNSHCSTRFRLNPLCNLVGTPGNHEFDEGKEELLRLLFGGVHPDGPFLDPNYRGATYANVSANVVDEDSGRPILSPLAIKILGGVPVAFIGAVLEATPTVVTPTGVAGLDFLDEADAINGYVAVLKLVGIRTIVVTIHQGGRQTAFEGPTPEEPASEVSGEIIDIVSRLDGEVAVVVSGHSHAFTNALLPSSDDEPVLVTQAFSASTAFGQIDLVLDRRTRDVVQKTGRVVTTFGDVAPGTNPQPDIAAMVAAAEELVAPLVNMVIGQAAGPLTRTANAAGESELGNLIADAQRAAMGTEFAFMNPGGIRADLEGGEVTWGELFTVQPFGNSLVRMTLTGQQVKELLEQQFIGTSTRLLSISGLSYTWSASQPVGDRVTEIRVGDGLIDPLASYTVTANSFLAAGGDSFPVLIDGTDRLGGPIDLDALIAHVESLPQPFSAAIEGRIQQVP
jgi:5'-nucleotidase